MFACLYIPNFPVAAAVRAEPELRNRALAIFEGKAPLEKIVALNEKAIRMGISTGITKAQAELCSELALRSRSTLQESSAHAALLDCAQSFSPCVEDTAWDTALLDLAGMESLFGSLPEISRTMANRATELGFITNVAIAGNPEAALIAARGFSGVTVIPEGKEAEQLGSLPIEVLFAEELGPTLRGVRRGVNSPDHQEIENHGSGFFETLDRWGIRDLHALAALPELALSERLGQGGLRLRQLARGSTSRTLIPIEELLVFEEAIELEHPLVLLEPLAFLLNRLLEQICVRLGSRALATQVLQLTLDLSTRTGVDDEFENLGIPSESNDHERNAQRSGESLPTVILSGADASRSEAPAKSKDLYSRQSALRKRTSPRHHRRPTQFVRKLSLPLPMLDPRLFLKLLQLDLQANPPGAPITKIHLAAEPTRPRSAQGGLFQPTTPEPEKLELTLARISSMVGEDKVGAIELLDTHHPEGFRMRRFASTGVALAPSPPHSSLESGPEEQAPVTALRLFRPPLRADVILENGQPARVLCRKKEIRGNVLWKAGPWRSSGDWWDHEPWSRDEWDIALQSDTAKKGESLALFRLVHDRLGGGWFVEGMYD